MNTYNGLNKNNGMNTNNNISIVINSHIKNVDIPLKKLLSTIKQNSNSNIYIYAIIGGCNEFKEYSIDDIHYIEVTHNSIDFTGLITLSEHKIIKTEWFFYLHDTCKVGKRFYDYILKMCPLLKNNYTYSFNRNSMNMGFYNINILLKYKKNLLTLKNNSTDIEDIKKFKRLGVHFEGFLFILNKENHLLLKCNKITDSPKYIYSDKILRITEYYKELDLYKYKANWYVKNNYELNA